MSTENRFTHWLRSLRRDTVNPLPAQGAKRRIKLPKRRWYRPATWHSHQPLPPRRKLSSAWQYILQATRLIVTDWRTVAGIGLVYGVAVFVFVRSFSLPTLSDAETTGGGFGSMVQAAVGELAVLISDASESVSAASGVYQIIVSTICGLALIWAFRQILSKESASTKQSFYRGMTPLVPYLLVLGMLGVHLVPVAIGGYLLNLMVTSGYFFGAELIFGLVIFLLLLVWSLRMVTHSLFALFIVTLPDMTPLRALRSAKTMVYRRRLLIWRKLLLIVLLTTFVLLIILGPLVVWAPAVAPWLFFVLSLLILPFGQAVLYSMYREIL